MPSIALSAALVTVVLLHVRAAADPRQVYLKCWFGLIPVVFVCVGVLLPVYLLHATATALIATVCYWVSAGPRTFVLGMVAAVLVSYGPVVAWTAHDLNGLLRRYPMVSVADRLAYEDERWPEQRTILRGAEPDLYAIGQPMATHQLANLHDHFVMTFIRSPGFGIARMSDPVSRLRWPDYDDPEVIAKSSDSAGSRPLSTGDVRAESETKATPIHDDDLARGHEFVLQDFLNPYRMGYARDRRHVAGFRPHAVRRMPQFGLGPEGRDDRWQLRGLQLISLLKHAEPRVYVSDQLPRMDELRDVPTRPLDSFEQAKLEELRRGKPVAIEASPQRIRLLGALVAGQQCTKCHDVERGTLLGAFSYDLRPADNAGP